jgi:hypothetical protein
MVEHMLLELLLWLLLLVLLVSFCMEDIQSSIQGRKLRTKF